MDQCNHVEDLNKLPKRLKQITQAGDGMILSLKLFSLPSPRLNITHPHPNYKLMVVPKINKHMGNLWCTCEKANRTLDFLKSQYKADATAALYRLPTAHFSYFTFSHYHLDIVLISVLLIHQSLQEPRPFFLNILY